MHVKHHDHLRSNFRHPAAMWGKRLVAVVLLAGIAGVWLGFVNTLVALAVVGFAAAIAGIRYPVLGLLGVALLTVIDPVMRHLLLNTGGWLRWNSFNYWLLAFTFLFFPRVWRLSDPHSRLLGLLLIVIAGGLMMAPRFEGGLQNLLNLTTVFAVVIYFQRTPRDAETMYWIGVVTGTAAAVGGYGFYTQAANLSLMNKNAFALFPLAGVLGACLAFPFAATTRGRLPVLGALAAINLMWVYLSGSRGTFLVALVAMAFLLVSMKTVVARVAYVATGLVVAGALSASFRTLNDSATTRFDTLFDSSLSVEERTSGRANLARGGWTLFRQHPLGVGTGAFDDAWAELEQLEVTNRWRVGTPVPPHSAWIMVLAENGIPGISLFVAYVISFAIVGLRRRDPQLLRIGLFATATLGVAFVFTEFQSKAIWFIAAAATVLLHQPTRVYAGPSRIVSRRRVGVFPRPTTADA